MTPTFRDLISATLFLLIAMYGLPAIPLLAWVGQ